MRRLRVNKSARRRGGRKLARTKKLNVITTVKKQEPPSYYSNTEHFTPVHGLYQYYLEAMAQWM